MNKRILLAAFIFPERLEWFLDYLENKFKINNDKVFCYKVLDDESKVVVTFKLELFEDNRLDLKKLFPSAVIIHKKGDVLYTINALNKLIEETYPDSVGNFDNKSIKVDWSTFQNKFILINNRELSILNIARIF